MCRQRQLAMITVVVENISHSVHKFDSGHSMVRLVGDDDLANGSTLEGNLFNEETRHSAPADDSHR